MEEVFKKLKEKHIRLTPQRLAVYEALARENKHLTVEEIYGKIKKRFPAVSLATVYSILELYRKKGIAAEIRITFNRSCFEARTDSHHHFFCRECKKIYDVELRPCPALQAAQVDGHSIEELHGYFYGICRECR
ncbi:MAG: transcriptional repressor [Candidatus Omnitrophica bacterium]|nr:transcriptional repressor [Candidatus Omnitrophota bacterium]MBU4479294.1 transcriptional repressor [Candidatus Omnitrophota bacterium]MCG2703275.1 transcriptional repressor [Candidatus Omnitrophota bacterium]